MSLKNFKKLQAGDEVHWTDPDQGLCSKTIKILAIEKVGNVAIIAGDDGSMLQCYARELS